MSYVVAGAWFVAWRKPSSKRWATFVSGTRRGAEYMRRVYLQQGMVCGKAQRRFVLIDMPKETP